MLSTHTPAPQEACTRILEEEIRKNKEQEISPSESVIADRLLARSMEMTDAYKELYNKMHVYPMALKVFLGAILSTSAYWYPEKMMQSRAALDELFKVNRQIKKAATNLAHLFSQRSERWLAFLERYRVEYVNFGMQRDGDCAVRVIDSSVGGDCNTRT